MPLTKKGKKILEKFQEEYGRTMGKVYFYSYMRNHPTRTKKWYRSLSM